MYDCHAKKTCFSKINFIRQVRMRQKHINNEKKKEKKKQTSLIHIIHYQSMCTLFERYLCLSKMIYLTNWKLTDKNYRLSMAMQFRINCLQII